MDQPAAIDYLWLALSLCPGIGAITARRLRQEFASVEAIWDAGEEELSACGLSEVSIKAMRHGPDPDRTLKKIHAWENQGIGICSIENPEYPVLLKEIYDPPMLLYTIGRRELLKTQMFSIVGARRASAYGEKAALKIGQDIASSGFTVVSGMALGIDARAHQGALRAGGNTIAVLGCGVDICYPAENKKLWNQIQKEGLLISEYPPGTEPKAGLFPRRNRLISGLSKGVVIVEAGEKSGSLITAGEALEQGRDIYAVPGSIFSYVSRGTNQLIRDSAAMLILQASDIPEIGRSLKQEKQEAPVFESEDERAVYEAIRPEGDTTDALLRCGIPIARLQQILSLMEIEGWIEQTADLKWIRQGSA